MFVFLLCMTAVFAANTGTMNFYDEDGTAIDHVGVWVFECADSSCSELTGYSDNDAVIYINTGSGNSAVITVGDVSQTTYYIAYVFADATDSYLPHYETFYFTGAGGNIGVLDVTLNKKDVCRSTIQSFSVTNSVEPYMPVIVDVEAALEADTYSAFSFVDDGIYDWGVDDSRYDDWYTSDVDVTLLITKELTIGPYTFQTPVYSDSTEVNIIADGTENVKFTYTPTQEGTYTAKVTTSVQDTQCASTDEQSSSQKYTVVGGNTSEYCYTLVDNLAVYDTYGIAISTPYTGETYTVAVDKISNAVSADGTLTALETMFTSFVLNENSDTDFALSETADMNTDTTSYETYSFSWTPTSVGDNTITVNGAAASCPYSTNNDETDELVIYVEEGSEVSDVFQPEITSCSADPIIAYIGEEIDFDADVSLTTYIYEVFGEMSYLWDFADGSSLSDKESAHSYTAAGIYDATITATHEDGGYDTCNVTVEIIENNVPTISCIFDGTTGYVNNAISLEVSASDSDGIITSYAWDFGDGNVDTTTTGSASNLYNTAGTYVATVVITDDAGATASCNGNIIIEEQPANLELSCALLPTEGSVDEELILNVEGSKDLIAFAWDFGDGNVDTTTTGSMIYSYTKAGTYTIFVEGADANANIASCSHDVTITENSVENEIPEAVCNGPYSSYVGEEITFSAGGSSDIDGIIVTYDWDFGDNTGQIVQNEITAYTYTEAGEYAVTMTVTDDAGETNSCTTTATVDVHSDALILDCSMLPTHAIADYPIAFNVDAEDSDGNIVRFDWDFGDGETESTIGSSTEHIYDSGNFAIRVTVTDDEGNTASCEQNINVAADTPAVAVASATPTSGESTLTVQFSSAGSSGDAPLIYKWSFGDGSGTSTSANPRHDYAKDGTYTAVLQVTDADGDTDTDSVIIIVTDGLDNNARDHYYIDGIAVSNDGIVNAGDTLELYISTKNIAGIDKSAVSFNAVIQELGIYATSGELDIDTGETEAVVLYMDIPADAVTGIYYARITVSDDDVTRIIYRDIVVEQK